MLQFISILISYALAGSQAYGILMNVNYEYVILPFCLFFTLVVVFGSQFIRGLISVLTFTKGSLLALVVLITVIVGDKAGMNSTSNFMYIGKPLLISTVALGGAVNLVPVCYQKVGATKRDLRNFITAIISGLFFVYLLNVIWCFYILKIVPQMGEISLAMSEQRGEIATIPLITIIATQFPEYDWIATVINVFIMLSITVSYITMSTGMKHVLDGFLRASASHPPQAKYLQWFNRMNPLLKKATFFVVSFGAIYLVAQTNPQGFIIVLEYFTSFGLNMEAGVFLTWMIGNARRKFSHIDVEYNVPYFVYKLRYLVMFYFVFAIFYDINVSCAALFFGYQ